MKIPEPARSILLSDIAYTFRDEIDDYTQIDFSNARHVELLKVAVDSSISKVSVKQGRPMNEPLDEFFVGLKGTMNALFLKDLADKTRRGQRGRVEKGRIPGGKSYGYNIVHSLKDNGQVERGQRTINEPEASVVRRICSEYVAGNSPRKIAASLNAEMTPSPRGSQWNASTINGNQKRRNGILNNELYLGRITYNRQRFVKDPDTGKRRSRPNPQKLWVITHVPELQIIEQDIWDKTQSLKQRYFSHRGNKTDKNVYCPGL